MAEREQEATTGGVSLGQYLASIRTARKLTLRQVEEATNKEVSNAYLSQIETGKIKQPSPNILLALSKLYAVEYDNLMKVAGFVAATASGATRSALRSTRADPFAGQNLTAEEEVELLEYLDFIRKRKRQPEQPNDSATGRNVHPKGRAK